MAIKTKMRKLDKEISNEIPIDWKLLHLIDLAKDGISNGVFNDPEKREGKFKLINVVDLYEEPYIKTEKLSFLAISEKEYENNKAEYCDLFFTRSSLKLEGIAHCNVLLSKEENITYDGHIMKISPASEIIDPLYLRYYCISERARNFFMRLAKHTTMTTIGQKDIAKLPVPIPKRNEQDKIVSIIKIWDEAISKTEKLIKAKKRYKKGFMQRLLSGKVRFQEFEGEDWVEVKLKKFFKPFSVKNKENEDLPILSCSKVHGITLQSNIFDKRVASKDIKRYKIVDKDDLIYDPMLLWDASIGFLKEVDRGVISPAYNTFKFKVNSGYRPFFEYLFDTHYMRYNYKAISQGTNRRRRKAPAEAFLGIDIKVPKSIQEQKMITTVLGTLTEEIELLAQEITLYQKQKKGLMQQLLTGKMRVIYLELA